MGLNIICIKAATLRVCWAWLLTTFWLGNEMFYFQVVPWLRRRVSLCHLWRTSKAGLAPAWGWRVALLSRSSPSLWWLGVRFVPVCFASKLCKIFLCLCVFNVLFVGKGTYRTMDNLQWNMHVSFVILYHWVLSSCDWVFCCGNLGWCFPFTIGLISVITHFVFTL